MKKLFAIFLVLCLLVSVVPVAAVETVTTEAQPQVESQPVSVESADPAAAATSAAPVTSSEVTVVREEESLRGEYEKHFLMSDGSYQAVVYSYPVHELVNGVWVELPIPEQTARGDVSPGNAQQNIIDNYVWQNHGVQDNNSVRLYIGKRSGNECRAFIRFATMPTIPAGATITAATMTVNIVSGTSTANLVDAYQVDDPWESSTIQWSNMPSIGTPQEFSISHNNKTKYQFSCLEAVREWYTDSTTGQNQNYGIMLRYSDNTIADYNSVYSADCTDATMRPSMVIGYTPPNSEINVLEGYTKQLPLPDTTETITWTSSNESVATVNSNGIVTGIKAGKVTITASAGGNELHTYTVYVKIEDGVYRIDYRDNNSYLGVNSGPIENATTVLRSVNDDGLPMYHQLWRVTYLAAGYYVLRPLHNQNMALHARDGVADVTTIGCSNVLSDVPAENRWTIEFLSGGYALKCQGSNAQMLRCTNNHPGSTVYAGSYIPTCIWMFESANSVLAELLLLDSGTGEIATDATRYVTAGETAEISDLGIMATFAFSSAYGSIPNITWTSSDSSKVSVNSQTGAVTGIAVGEFTTVIAHCVYQGMEYSKAYVVYVAEEDVPVLRIRHYFDLGYDVREGDARAAIQSYQNAVSAKFYQIFGIKLYYSVYDVYTSICDRCVLDQSHVINSDTLETLCRHNPSCATTMNLRNELFSSVIPGDEITTVVIWSGRKMSAYVADRTNSMEINHSIVMTTYGIADWNALEDAYGPPIDTSKIYESLTNTLFHELSHQLGAPDHYCYKDWNENSKCSNDYCDSCVYGYDKIRKCIMGYDTLITHQVVYCDDCLSMISDHIEDHHYPLSN